MKKRPELRVISAEQVEPKPVTPKVNFSTSPRPQTTANNTTKVIEVPKVEVPIIIPGVPKPQSPPLRKTEQLESSSEKVKILKNLIEFIIRFSR